jgi:O-antigen ligase
MSSMSDSCPKIILLPNGWMDWLFFVFTILTFIFSNITGMTYLYVNFAYGVTIFFAFYFLKKNIKPPPEVFIYWFWLLWAAFVGAFVALDQSIHMNRLWTCCQMALMVFVIACFQKTKRDMGLLFFAIIIAVGIISYYSIMSGEINLAQHREMLSSYERVAGLTENPNTLGYYFLCVVFGMSYIAIYKKKLLARLICFSFIILCFLGILYTQSRKSVFGFLGFYFFWFLFNKKYFSKKPILALLIIIIIGAVGFGVMNFLKETRVWTRFEGISEGEASSAFRKELYKIGFEIAKQYPFTGVGLNNFLAYTATRSSLAQAWLSHSNYLEVLTNTGIPGFFLYYMMHLILWLRLRRISRLAKNLQTLNVVSFMTTILFSELLFGFTTVQYVEKGSRIVFFVLVGYSAHLENMLLISARNRHAALSCRGN